MKRGLKGTHSLDSGQSQTLKVSPTRKVLSLISYGKGGASEKVGNVINLHFEGNWMPLKVCCLHIKVDMMQLQSQTCVS